jgi:glycosyltransferase involved in cell wall biosynthesis
MVERHSTVLPPDRVSSFPAFGLQYRAKVQRARSEQQRTEAWIWGGKQFCKLAARTLNTSYSTVYAFSSASKELFESARELGIQTVLDHATAPIAFERALVRAEVERFKGWTDQKTTCCRADDEYQERQADELRLADVVLCGSSFIRSAIIDEGVPPERVRVVPLGISERFFYLERHHSDGPLKVLFVGDDALRKGVGYLAQAMKLLGPRLAEARLVGNFMMNREGLAALDENTSFLGPVSRGSMDQHFAWADVLVLPSVSDTFGLVILEAMASGLPVIATDHTCAPDVLRDGIQGFIVPLRDHFSIAARLHALATDRNLLDWMSDQARTRAYDFTLPRYAARLIDAINI